MKPGQPVNHNGAEWTVERIQLRGVDEHWAKLVIYTGSGKARRLVNQKWIRYNEGGSDDG